MNKILENFKSDYEYLVFKVNELWFGGTRYPKYTTVGGSCDFGEGVILSCDTMYHIVKNKMWSKEFLIKAASEYAINSMPSPDTYITPKALEEAFKAGCEYIIGNIQGDCIRDA